MSEEQHTEPTRPQAIESIREFCEANDIAGSEITAMFNAGIMVRSVAKRWPKACE